MSETERKTYARLTPEQVADAIRQSLGNLSRAARILGCDRRTISRWMKRSALVQQAWHEAYETFKDLAEHKLLQAVQNGEPWAIQLVLTRLGRDRGYGDHLTLEATTRHHVRVQLVWDDVPQVDDAHDAEAAGPDSRDRSAETPPAAEAGGD